LESPQPFIGRAYREIDPFTVSRNVGVALGIAIGRTESGEMFRVFADGLIEDGL
jgi:hypothetical protein